LGKSLHYKSPLIWLASLNIEKTGWLFRKIRK
jgi:hypothetical protein